MEKLSRALDEVDQKVAQYRHRFETLTKEAAELKIKLDKENETIEAAETLVSKLHGEFTRWNSLVIYNNGHEPYYRIFSFIFL